MILFLKSLRIKTSNSTNTYVTPIFWGTIVLSVLQILTNLNLTATHTKRVLFLFYRWGTWGSERLRIYPVFQT